MSDTILGGDFTVYYSNDTGGDKQIIWTGSATDTRTMNELYGALQDLFDDVTGGAGDQMDEGIPIRALTPSEYLIGEIELNDNEPWFIDHDTIEHLSGGSITSVGWNRDLPGDGTGDIGIVQFDYTVSGGTDFAASDIGKTITHSVGGDSGRLLHFDTDGSNGTAWIRPDSNALANDWNSTGGNVTVTSGTGANLSQDTAASTGEDIYVNIYTIGTIEADTQIYIYQNKSPITSWWGSGHIDVLIEIQELGTLIDDGLLSIYARQYGKLYDQFIADVSGGGRNPIPLATSADPNNTTGYNSITLSSATGTWNVGNYIYYDNAGALTWSTTTKKGVIASGDSGATPTIEYYLIGDLTDFADTDEVTEYDPATGANGDANGDVNGAPVATTDGPADTVPSALTITLGSISRDLSNGNGTRPYSVELDLQTNISVAELYERLKYVTRRGQTTDIDTLSSPAQSIIGQEYVGVGDYYIPYDNTTGSFTEGGTLTSTDQADFSGTITSDYDRGSSSGFLIVRDVRGTLPADGEDIRDGTVNADVDEDAGADPIETISPVKVSPFGTFAGGKFFGARGVWLKDVPTSDATNYQLIDSEGVEQIPPNNVPIIVTGVVENTQCYVYDSTPTSYLNTEATTNVSGNEYQASITYGYSSDISVTIRTRELGYLPFETSGTIESSGLNVTAVFQIDPNFKFTVTGENISFTNPSTITRTNATFITEGWINVMSQVTVEGSASNDGTYTISSVAASALTITGGTVSTAGAAAGITLTFTRRAPTW